MPGMTALASPSLEQARAPQVVETLSRIEVPAVSAAVFGQLPEGCRRLGPTCDWFIPVRPPAHHRMKASGPAILYLNFEGGLLTAGDDDPVAGTALLPGMQGLDQAQVPPFSAEDYRLPGTLETREDAIEAVAGWVAQLYAPFDVVVTTTRPPDTVSYTMAIIGGSIDVLAMSPGTLGVSPWDCDDSDPSNVVFIFSEEMHDLYSLAMTIVHEAGHSFGLSHIDDEDGIMYPVNSSSHMHWSSGNVPDGQACDGSSFQDSAQILTDNLGLRPEQAAPWVAFVSPKDGAVQDKLNLVLVQVSDDVAVTSVHYSLDGEPIGLATWPDLSLTVDSLEPGDHILAAVAADATDAAGVQRQAQATISFTIDPFCAQQGTCTTGKSPVGAACTAAEDCATGLCARDPASGDQVCAKTCDVSDPCPGLIGLSQQALAATQCLCAQGDPSCCLPQPEDCANGMDDDCDGAIDCADTDCQAGTFCTGRENCTTEIDDDFDGLTNCDDPDCASTEACGCVPQIEDCSNGMDDDCDGLIDCADRQNCPGACNAEQSTAYCAKGQGPITVLGKTGSQSTSPRLDGCSSTGPIPGTPWTILLLLGLWAFGVTLHRRKRPADRSESPNR